MSYVTNLLTIPAPFKGGNDWISFISTHEIRDSQKGSTRKIELTVERKPDKHSFRFSELANRHKADPTQPPPWPEANIVHEERADNNTPISNTTYDFWVVQVIDFIPGGGRERIKFSVAKYSIFKIANSEVFFD